MASRWRANGGAEINLAPLLDVIFCLLFFFVLATSLRQRPQALEVQVPTTGQPPFSLEKQERLEVTITEDNRILFDGELVNGAELAQALRAAMDRLPQGRAPEEVFIRSDGQADVQTFVEVTDACAEAGIKAALMETLPKPPDGAE